MEMRERGRNKGKTGGERDKTLTLGKEKETPLLEREEKGIKP